MPRSNKLTRRLLKNPTTSTTLLGSNNEQGMSDLKVTSLNEYEGKTLILGVL